MSTDENERSVDLVDEMDTVDVSLGIFLLRRTGRWPVRAGNDPCAAWTGQRPVLRSSNRMAQVSIIASKGRFMSERRVAAYSFIVGASGLKKAAQPGPKVLLHRLRMGLSNMILSITSTTTSASTKRARRNARSGNPGLQHN